MWTRPPAEFIIVIPVAHCVDVIGLARARNDHAVSKLLRNMHGRMHTFMYMRKFNANLKMHMHTHLFPLVVAGRHILRLLDAHVSDSEARCAVFGRACLSVRGMTRTVRIRARARAVSVRGVHVALAARVMQHATCTCARVQIRSLRSRSLLDQLQAYRRSDS